MMQRNIITALATMLVVCASPFANAQQTEQLVLDETLSGSFGKVWAAVQRAMNESNCGKPQNMKVIEPEDVDGFYRGIYVSDYCVLATGEETTAEIMKKYGNTPRIRNGIWVNGRIQYRLNVREERRNETRVILKAELSGFEEYITNQMHFWNSNGDLERKMMELIKKYTAEEVKKASEQED
jgi:hypothetical protein